MAIVRRCFYPAGRNELAQFARAVGHSARLRILSFDSGRENTMYIVNIVCEWDRRARARAFLLRGFSVDATHLLRLDSSNIEDCARVEVPVVLSRVGQDAIVIVIGITT